MKAGAAATVSCTPVREAKGKKPELITNEWKKNSKVVVKVERDFYPTFDTTQIKFLYVQNRE